jgi:hypothetical protein
MAFPERLINSFSSIECGKIKQFMAFTKVLKSLFIFSTSQPVDFCSARDVYLFGSLFSLQGSLIFDRKVGGKGI